MFPRNKTHKIKGQNGFSLAELVIVILVIAIIVVISLPQIISSRRQTRFTEMQRQIVASLTEARQDARLQRAPITFSYDDSAKRTVIYGGSLGALGDTRNKITELSGTELVASEIIYGRPGGAPASELADTSNMTPLNGKTLNITFQPDGTVLDANNKPFDNALFFYNGKSPQSTAFAISVLSAGGRIKLWRYNQNIKLYVE